MHRGATWILVVLVGVPACDSRPVPEELPPFRATLALRLPVKAPGTPVFPWGITIFCPKKDEGPPCRDFAATELDAGSVRLDPWCVAIAVSGGGPQVSAGAVTVTDAAGRVSRVPAPKTDCKGAGCGGEYLLLGFDPSPRFDLEGDLPLDASGDVIPAFSLSVPAGPWPGGKVELGRQASRTDGLPVLWHGAIPGTTLELTILPDGDGPAGDISRMVTCVYPASSPPDRVSSAVVRWFADQGVKSVDYGAYVEWYKSETQGPAELVVTRGLEYFLDTRSATIVP